MYISEDNKQDMYHNLDQIRDNLMEIEEQLIDNGLDTEFLNNAVSGIDDLMFKVDTEIYEKS